MRGAFLIAKRKHLLYYVIMNILGIDFGLKRIGIAVGNTEERIAFPREVLQNDTNFIRLLKQVIQKDTIKRIVLGLPTMLSGEESSMTHEVYAFAEHLEKECMLPIYFEEERLSTQAIKSGTVKKKHIDAASAALILQTYLDRV
jgi:putative holliday junction resolvase